MPTRSQRKRYLLLSNFDRISWKVWEIIFTLWPVLIVAAGIDLMFNQKSTWQLTIAGLLVISIMGILAILFDRGITSRPLEENKLTQARGEATIGFLTIRPSFVMLKLVSQGNSELLITGSTKKWNGERIQSSYEIMNETGNYLLESSGMLFLYEPGVKNRAQWNLGVNSRIPVKIAIDQVVGEQDLDLTGLMIDDFGINLILGKSRIQLPSDQTLQGSIKVNFGEVVVNVPVGVGVRVEGKPVIGGVIVPETYEQINGDFESNNYNRAEYKVVLIINQLIGQVTIHQK